MYSLLRVSLYKTFVLDTSKVKPPHRPPHPSNGGWNGSSTKNTNNGMKRDDRSLIENGTERDVKEQEWNDWKKGTRKERSS